MCRDSRGKSESVFPLEAEALCPLKSRLPCVSQRREPLPYYSQTSNSDNAEDDIYSLERRLKAT